MWVELFYYELIEEEIVSHPSNEMYSSCSLLSICSFLPFFIIGMSSFRVTKKYVVTKGANFSTTASKLAADLTADMLARYRHFGVFPGFTA